MTYFPQKPAPSHYDYINALQQRVQRRRQNHSRSFSLNDILHLCSVRYGSISSSMRAITFPRRYALHLLIIGIVLVTSSTSFLSVNRLSSSGNAHHSPVTFLTDLVAPVFPQHEPTQYTGELPVDSGAFAHVDAFPVPLDHPRLYAPFTATAHSIVDQAGLRSGPGSDYDLVETLISATPVQVIGRYTDWLLIRGTDGNTAWIAAELLDLNPTAVDLLPQVQDIPAPPPPQIGIVTTPQLALRDGPGTAYVSMTNLPTGVRVDLLAHYEGWYQVQTPEGGIGWVSADYLQIEPGVSTRVPVVNEIPDAHPALVGMIAASTVNLRNGPGIAYNRIGSLSAGASLDLLGSHRDWLQIRTSAGATGWVSAELVQVSDYIARRLPQVHDIPALPQPPRQQPAPLPQPAPPQPAPQPLQPPPQPLPQPEVPLQPVPELPQPLPQPEVPVKPVEPVPVAPIEPPVEPVPVPPVEPPPPVEPAPVPAVPASSVVDFALQFLGASYSWGGASPSGFDCSGFTMYVYQNFGVNLPHSAAAQYSTKYGAIIASQAELAPGDLVFFANTYAAGISHVGIYIGGGNVVQALSPGRGVGIANLNESYWAEHYYSSLRPYL